MTGGLSLPDLAFAASADERRDHTEQVAGTRARFHSSLSASRGLQRTNEQTGAATRRTNVALPARN